MKLRKWNANDVPQIYKIETESFSSPWSERVFRETVEARNVFGLVAEDGEDICGFICCIFDGFDGEILNIAVRAEKRRMGIGNALIEGVIELLGGFGAERVFLDVRRGNEPAKALYRKLGFTPVYVRKKYYENTEDAIVMEKTLRERV